MIEAVIIEYLNDNLSVPAYGQRPEDISGSFVVVEKTGSTTDNRVTTSTLAIQSNADRLSAAADLNEQVKAAMMNAVSLDSIGGVELASDYNFTNTASKQYRYQAVFNVTHY